MSDLRKFEQKLNVNFRKLSGINYNSKNAKFMNAWRVIPWHRWHLLFKSVASYCSKTLT